MRDLPTPRQREDRVLLPDRPVGVALSSRGSRMCESRPVSYISGPPNTQALQPDMLKSTRSRSRRRGGGAGARVASRRRRGRDSRRRHHSQNCWSASATGEFAKQPQFPNSYPAAQIYSSCNRYIWIVAGAPRTANILFANLVNTST